MSDPNTESEKIYTVGELRQWIDARHVADDTPIFLAHDEPGELHPVELACRGLTLEESTTGGFLLTAWS